MLVDSVLSDAGFHTVVVEMNLRSVDDLARRGRSAIYGDGTKREVLIEAGIRRAEYFVVTLPGVESRQQLGQLVKELNPNVRVVMRARYLAEKYGETDDTLTVFEEGETGLAMARQVMRAQRMDPEQIDAFLGAVRRLWHIRADEDRD